MIGHNTIKSDIPMDVRGNIHSKGRNILVIKEALKYLPQNNA
jgi:hypothetical protein